MAAGFVLVGYDGSRESEDALRWGVGEAILRGTSLTLCHAWRWPYPVAYVDYEGVEIVKRTGERLLDHGVRLVRGMAPGLEVRRRLLDGPAYAALLHEAHDAGLLVVGSHGRGEVSVGSTALRLPARARSPVVVVRGSTRAEYGEVVVGADGSAGGEAALAFGFEEAAMRGWRLRAVFGCWEPSAASEDDLSLFADEDELGRVCGERLDDAVAPWRDSYPDVDALATLRLCAPREALFEAAQRADLVVVGNRGVAGLDPLMMGATSGALLQHAPCAVAIVQPVRRGDEGP
ncbi:universal stress protein [Actinomadura viridis]|uniref:universal stress protein n=1 Tax=Actinomadura viridis TaxID=58110 RepID=UPI0036ACB1C9